MFLVIVEAEFSAVHRLRLADGTVEPQHGHDWSVRACFARPQLDDCGMVIDFQHARSLLESALEPLHHTDLNHHEAFRGLNPTAELVARYVFERIAERETHTVRRIEVTEAPGCVAVYEPE